MAKLYRHYKGNLYEYIGECYHSETLEEMVIYKALYGEGKTWVRPKTMFFEEVTLADGLSSSVSLQSRTNKYKRYEKFYLYIGHDPCYGIMQPEE